MTNRNYEDEKKQNEGMRDTSPTATKMQKESAFDPMTGQKRHEPGTSDDSFLETGKSLLDQVKSTASHAYDTAAEKATSKIEEQKSSLSSGLTSVAGSVRQIGENLQGDEAPQGIAKLTAEYSDTAAQKIEQAANYFENNDLNAMYSDVESFARKNPMVLIGGAFVVGILAARFLKSSRPKTLTTAAGQNFGAVGSQGDGRSNGEYASSSSSR